MVYMVSGGIQIAVHLQNTLFNGNITNLHYNPTHNNHKATKRLFKEIFFSTSQDSQGLRKGGTSRNQRHTFRMPPKCVNDHHNITLDLYGKLFYHLCYLNAIAKKRR